MLGHVLIQSFMVYDEVGHLVNFFSEEVSPLMTSLFFSGLAMNLTDKSLRYLRYSRTTSATFFLDENYPPKAVLSIQNYFFRIRILIRLFR